MTLKEAQVQATVFVEVVIQAEDKYAKVLEKNKVAKGGIKKDWFKWKAPNKPWLDQFKPDGKVIVKLKEQGKTLLVDLNCDKWAGKPGVQGCNVGKVELP